MELRKPKSVHFRETMQQLVTKRIGTENFLDRIQHIYKTEYYTQASKAPEVRNLKNSERIMINEAFFGLIVTVGNISI